MKGKNLKIHGDSRDSTVGADKGLRTDFVNKTLFSHIQTKAASRLQTRAKTIPIILHKQPCALIIQEAKNTS